MNQIIVRGARQHNLKNIDVILPRNRFIVITGVSGSGKSSLAFDTLFAEGQRRYIEALSTHARQYLQRLEAPPVDEIKGLSPAIAVSQKAMPRSPRSTVGTLTEIHDYLRLLYATLGTVYCPGCSVPVNAYTVFEMVSEISADWPRGSRILILAPLGIIGERELPGTLKRLRKDGYARVRFEGAVYELDPPPLLPRRASYPVDVVVDRLILDETKLQRLAASLELAAKLGHGMVKVVNLGGTEKSFSESLLCISCGRKFLKPTLSLFSFHHPAGACPKCNGLGFIENTPDSSYADYELLVPFERKSEASRESSRHAFQDSRLSAPTLCSECNGSRLNEQARSVQLGGLSIDLVSRLSLPAVREWLAEMKLSSSRAQVAERPREEVLQRLSLMDELGLSYLSLSRSAHTLSGGEAQRIRLAQQISTKLSGVLYVLDEPSMGLHPRDHAQLLNVLFRLRDAGNTVIVVEHDRETILKADFVVDIGPGAGANGGELIFSGSPTELLSFPASLTGSYLSGRRSISVSRRRRPFGNGALSVYAARGHNLKGISVKFPLGCITCVTGVSGSGKSTLVLHTLYRAMAGMLHGSKYPAAPFDRIEGAEAIRKVVLVDQAPLGRTPRSTPATYTGLFALIRQLYSQIPEARARGYRVNRFSFNVKGGRCETCKGEGLQRLEMYFLPDVFVTCPACGGSRFNRETLEILFKGRSIADALEMSVHEAVGFFENFPAISRKLRALQEVGLGYLRIGQSATTLSGGEAQRVKLATELGRKVPDSGLYILDEPTTGLHFNDIEKLLHIFQKLADLGHTLIIIEHHPDVIKTADYVIDLGPQGGEKGGYVVAAGTPEEVAQAEESFTGRYLKESLKLNA